MFLTYHTFRRHGWDIWGKRFANGDWQPSEPIVDRPGVDKHPTVALQGSRLWLFWESHAADGAWHIASRTRTSGEWSAVEIFGDAATERRLPAAAVDDTGGLWLFWLERIGDAWRVRYNRHDGTHWQLPQPATLPPVGAEAPQVEDDLILTFHPSSTAGRLFLFWARHEQGDPGGQTRWTVAYRVKQGTDPNASDWSPIRVLPRPGGSLFHDREPFPLAVGRQRDRAVLEFDAQWRVDYLRQHARYRQLHVDVGRAGRHGPLLGARAGRGEHRPRHVAGVSLEREHS